MYKTKRAVDNHVEKLLMKLSVKEFKTRAYSVARMYFDAGDYASCQKYVEQYLSQKDNNAAAYKLLGQAFQKMRQKDKALVQFETSVEIDQTQKGTILDICELLADEEVSIDSGRATYWFEKAESIFPKHPVTDRLRERLMTLNEPDPEEFIDLLNWEINVRPNDPWLHAKLLENYLKMNKFAEAFEHSCDIEFSSLNFTNNYTWYEVLDNLIKHNLEKTDMCLYQLLLLTVKERLTLLSLTETPTGASKSLVESAELLHSYDQALESVAKAGAAPGFAEFHACLLQHHRGQFSFHAATLLLKRAKNEISGWSDSTKAAAPLMLLAWQTVPLHTKVTWLRNAPDKLQNAVNRWYSEGTYRCSQSGHYLLTNYPDKNQSLLDQISQCCSGAHWKKKMYEKIFTAKTQGSKIQSSHFNSNAINAPQLRLPRKSEVEAYDSDAQKEYGNSLHHFVWTLLNYKNFAHFHCTLFDMLSAIETSSGSETLNELDIYAFLYCATLTTRQQKSNEVIIMSGEKPKVLPANITDLLCPLSQMKWWDCAYKFSQNILDTKLTDIRAILSRGIEVVRCIDDYSLDPELLCILGRIFSERADVTTSVDQKNHIETRAGLYYRCAIPLLEKLKSKVMIRVSDKRLFDYTHKDIGTKELNGLIEESKLFVAVLHIKENEYEKAIELLISVKSQQSYYHLAQAFKKLAVEESHSFTESSKSKYALFLSKAKTYAYKGLNFKEHETNRCIALYSDIQELIEDIEICMNKMDDSKNTIDKEETFSSDEDRLYHNEHRRTNRNVTRSISSTPKAKHNNTNYQTALDSQILETTRLDQKHLESLGNEIQNLQKRNETVTNFMDQTKTWFEDNRNLRLKIINTINTDVQNTTDTFQYFKISVDEVKDQIDECRIECKEIGHLKKQMAELKKEVEKLKQVPSEQNRPAYGLQLPFTPQMIPPFNQRFPLPPNPYQLYHQNPFNNQYSHTGQSSSVPVGQPLFEQTWSQMNFRGVYPTYNMYLDAPYLFPPIIQLPHTIPTAPIVPPVPVTSAPAMATKVSTDISRSLTKTTETKDISRTLPVNVVVTSSDLLPTPTSMPAPMQRVKPATTKTQASEPPVFNFSMPGKNSIDSSLPNWNKTFQTFSADSSSFYDDAGDTSLITCKSVTDGPFAGANNSQNKYRTLSEKSNTSVESYDPCPDFKPIVPLPAEVKVTTGEEDEIAIFSSRAKLYRFVDKQWKERGIGEIKLLKHKRTGKVRVLMRREQVHKICANHIITPEMEINPMKNETKAYIWVANDFAEETVVLEKFCVRFKTEDIAKEFYETFVNARLESAVLSVKTESKQKQNVIIPKSNVVNTNKPQVEGKTTVGGSTIKGTPLFKPEQNDNSKDIKTSEVEANKTNIFSNLSLKTGAASSQSNMFNVTSALTAKSTLVETTDDANKSKLNSSDTVEDFEPNIEFKPVISLPALVEQVTGEENEISLFEDRAKLLRYDSSTKEWKERGLGIMKLLAQKDNTQKTRLLMRRERIMKVCCNHVLTKQMTFQKMPNMDKAVTLCAKDFADGELIAETFCLRFKTVQACDKFIQSIKAVQDLMESESKEKDIYIFKAESWYCQGCYTKDLENFKKFAICEVSKTKVDGDRENKQYAKDLMLHDNLYMYNNVENCLCDGCQGWSCDEPCDVLHVINKTVTCNQIQLYAAVVVELKMKLNELFRSPHTEKDEICLFQHRAMLNQYDRTEKKWIEQLSGIKLLARKDNTQNIRLLIKSEYIVKVCCNHVLTQYITFQKWPHIDRAVYWFAENFSEGKKVQESFGLRFKTAQACDNFMTSIKLVQEFKKEKLRLRRLRSLAENFRCTAFLFYFS